MLEDETENAWSNQEGWNHRDPPQTDSKLIILSGREKDEDMEMNDHTKSWT